jgi:L,D-peptidoglycan transpeptidase YkuD (ErfK/YbiS/YcfS/YnhG family)
MIIVKKSGYLKYKNIKFRCALGKGGVKKKEKEGDSITPKGTFKILNIYYRADRIKKLKLFIKKIKIKKNMGWCDDPKSQHYNKQIRLPSRFSHEKLYRNDNLYDLIAVINYNIKPIIKNKGSAIFLHIAKKNYEPTKGCIAIKKRNFLLLINNLKKENRIKIQ